MTPADRGPDTRQLIAAFVGLADTLVDDYDVIDLLDRLVAHSVELLAADAAGILLADPQGRLRAVASSSEDAQLMELLQIQAEQGPCVDCYRSGSPVAVPDLDAAARQWPRFVASLAAHKTYRSVHALPMRLRGEGIGALNLFHRRPGALGPTDIALAQGLADIATIGILQERAIHRGEVLNEQLQTALNNRVIIEQAKGVLSQLGGLSMPGAFDRLRTYSRERNLRLSEVARQVVQTDLAADVLSAPYRRRS